MGNPPIDPVYLPFDETTVLGHFAPVKGEDEASRRRRVDYYLASARSAAGLRQIAKPTQADIRAARQMEKDERFWTVASLLALYYDQTSGGRVHLFAELMRRAGLPAPNSHDSWEQVLSGPLFLHFEASLSSPMQYRNRLAENLDQHAMIPYARAAATKAGLRLEGATKVDAILTAPESNTAVVFEAKVLSDLSTRVSFDATRNQLARIIDVVLDDSSSLQHPLNTRDPDRTYVVLVTPKLLSPHGPVGASRGRLYGWLLPAYQTPDCPLLAQHLPHRQDLRGIHARLGWATWEQINDLRPGACRWLDAHVTEPNTAAQPATPPPAS